jgi:hypothetical protein
MAPLELPSRAAFPAVARTHVSVFIWLVPALALLAGLVVRYLGFRAALPDADLSQMVASFCRWDCEWYVRLAETGYDPFPVPARTAAANWAFFPLYPVAVGLLAQMVPLDTIWVATLVSLALSYLAVLLAWPMLGRDRNAYAVFAVYVLAGPFAVYFTTFFTEVLFLLLTLWVFRALARSAYLEAGFAIALLSATRIVGVFATLSLALKIVLDHFAAGGTWRNLLPAILLRPALALAVVIAPLGLFAYMAFLVLHIGDGLAFSHVQIAWARSVGNPFAYLFEGLMRMPEEGFWPTSSQILALAALFGLAMTGLLAWRRRWPEALFCLICVLLPLAAGLASMLRFVSALAPVVLLASELAGRNRIAAIAVCALLMLSGYFTTLGWFGGHLALV